VGEELIRVCTHFFKALLDITDRLIRTAAAKVKLVLLLATCEGNAKYIRKLNPRQKAVCELMQNQVLGLKPIIFANKSHLNILMMGDY
jgi:hypothetical protein